MGLRWRALSLARLAALAGLLVVILLPQVASAQGGIAVFTGRVTIDGAPAPAGTVVQLALQSSGERLGLGRTGNAGLDSDQYRIDVQQSAVAPGAIVEFSLIDPATGAVRPTLEKPTAMNRANFVITTDLSFTLGAETPTPRPVATATPVPTPTPTAVPTATPTPTATPIPPTATPTPTPTPFPTSTPFPTAVPTPTPPPKATPAPEPTATPAPATTPVPPTATPDPTATSVPPTATSIPPAPTAAPTATPEAGGGDDGGSSLGVVWIVIAIIAAAAVGLAVFVWRNRRR